MRKSWILITIVTLAVSFTSLAQRPSLTIITNMELWLEGQTNEYHRIELSSDLKDWTWKESFFLLLTNPHVQTVSGTENPQKFFRAVMASSNWTVMNNSISDPCPEHDPISVVFRGQISNFWIIATHPLIQATNFSCGENTNGCPPVDPGTDYTFTPAYWHPPEHDTGITYLNARRDEKFWRPQGMNILVNGVTTSMTNVHYIEIGGYNAGWNHDYPIFFVLYCDGNIRLIPFPSYSPKVCFGTSVIVGPAPVSSRPYVDIESVDFTSAFPGPRILTVRYRNGGTAVYDIQEVTGYQAKLKVTVDFPTSKSFCTVRSMWVSDTICDTAYLRWTNSVGTVCDYPVLTALPTAATDYFLYKKELSTHNQTAPDIRVVLQ